MEDKDDKEALLLRILLLVKLVKLWTLVRFGGATINFGDEEDEGEAEVGVEGWWNGLDILEEADNTEEEEEAETILPMLTLSLVGAYFSSSFGVVTDSSAFFTDSNPNTSFAFPVFTLAFELGLAPPSPSSRKRSPTLGTLKIACGGGGSSTSNIPHERVCFSCWRFAPTEAVAFVFNVAPPPTFTFTPSPPPPTPGAPCKNPESIVDVVEVEWWWNCPPTPTPPAPEALALLSISLNRARSAESASSLARFEDRLRLGWRVWRWASSWW
jgi:hypothetical protein